MNSLLPTPDLLGECPIWHAPTASLTWIDVPGHVVHRLDTATGRRLTWPVEAEPGCVALASNGADMIVAVRNRIVRIDAESGRQTEIAVAPFDPTHHRFNDGRCDSRGRLWIGVFNERRDAPSAGLWCLEHDTLRQGPQDIVLSNGIAFSPDERWLYQSDTVGKVIFRYPYDIETGTCGERQVFADLGAEDGTPDGASVDSEGRLWVALYGAGSIVALSGEGRIVERLELPVRCPTMPGFGGDDLRTLFVTTSRFKRPAGEFATTPLAGRLLTASMPVAGLPEHPYGGQA
jgi:sugar lactone lactonase YvrE